MSGRQRTERVESVMRSKSRGFIYSYFILSLDRLQSYTRLSLPPVLILRKAEWTTGPDRRKISTPPTPRIEPGPSSALPLELPGSHVNFKNTNYERSMGLYGLCGNEKVGNPCPRSSGVLGKSVKFSICVLHSLHHVKQPLFPLYKKGCNQLQKSPLWYSGNHCHTRGSGFEQITLHTYPRNFSESIGSGTGFIQLREDNLVAN